MNPHAKVPNRLVGILGSLLLAYVLSYALGSWLDRQIPNLVPPVATVDGSSLNTSRYYKEHPDTLLAAQPDAEALLDFYTYLDKGGRSAYQNWRNARTDLSSSGSAFRLRALQLADATNTGKYLSLFLLIFTLLLLYGRGLRESRILTPVFYLIIFTGTTALYGSLSAPLFTGAVVGFIVLYFAGLRLFLPIYHTEWVRLMRPGLTFSCFLLAVMAWRGPELVDYWFWTSQLFRLALVTVILLTLFFHLSILTHVLKAAKMDGITRIFAFGMPLGTALFVFGLALGLYGDVAGAGLIQINHELVMLPPETVANFNPDVPFVLFFAGIMLLILGGIGYFIQKIAR
ncbi:MAG: hypothetical protein ACI81P_002806 [Neolewinella sp.]